MTVLKPRDSRTPTSEDGDQDVAELGRRLAESEAWFATLAETMPQLVWSRPQDGEPDYFNGRWRTYAGMPSAGRWTDWIHPDDLEEALAAWGRSFATGEPYQATHRMRDRTGDWRQFETRARAIRNAAGAPTRWLAVSTNVEDRLAAHAAAIREEFALDRAASACEADLAETRLRAAAEAEVRLSEQTARRDVDALYAAYIDNTTDGVFVVAVTPGAPPIVETVNRVVERTLGAKRDELQGRALADVLPDAIAERMLGKIAEWVSSDRPTRYEETVEIDGVERVFEFTLAPVAAADGRLARVVGSARDLTERREAEQQLRQAQKMEAVGQLTGGVAHDFNNLLQVVRGNLELLATDLGVLMTPTIERRLRDAMAGAERGAKLTRQLLAFSRRQPLAPQPTDVGALIVSMGDLFDRTLGETVEVEISCDPGGWTALVDPAQLENAVLNLAINGRDAMPDGGKLSIAVRNLAGADSAGDWIEIAVSDAGVGMTGALLARVFEPFFSTKPEGRGTGLGLPQVQGFIEQSNGGIDIKSAPGLGTTVRLSLPRGEAIRDAAAAQAEGDARGRGERILLLEDDDAVRRSVADLLAALGYGVDSAGTTSEAAALLDRGERFDLLLSDVVMPGAPTPPDFARLVRRSHPAMKVLFMSGYAEDGIVHQGRVDADVHLIEKPYRQDELARKLRQLLDVAPARAAAVRQTPLSVLLVEDEPLIAMSLVELLGSFGYTVFEARTAAAAKIALTREAGVDLMLTDLGLPDMDGEALAQWCRAERPGLPIVFATGRDDFEAPPLLLEGGPVGVVTKPFDTRTLRATIEACAARP